MRCVTCKKDKPYDTDHFKLKGEDLGVTCLICLAAKKKWAEENKEKRLANYKANKEHIKIIKNAYYETHKIKINTYRKAYYESHQDELKANYKTYYDANKKRINSNINNYHHKRRKTDIQFKLTQNLRNRLNRALNGNYKVGSAISDLGCSIEEFKKHLESQFHHNPKTGEVMTWENHGIHGWHIDHIEPLSSFNLSNREEFLKACHYSNLQPLWWFDNLKKGDTDGN